MKSKLLRSVIGGTLLLTLTACGDAEVQKVNGEKQEESAPKEETTQPEFYKLGETISVDGMEVTVHSASWGTPVAGVEPQGGKVLRLEVTATNNSSDNGFIDSTEFDVATPDGTMAEEYFGNDDANMFGGEIKKSKQIKGVLEFDVTEADFYEVYYEPSFTLKENAEVKWKVEKSEVK
ncbi:hypothetical protein CD798_05865 [Bacillaceae bacterium SAOS 7]|nr:hypothetical protein CD798_05865 [Bacillaceae bacterium SAOS 7]